MARVPGAASIEPQTIEVQTIEVQTSQGLARVHLRRMPAAQGAVVLGHGAGGGVSAPDLRAATAAAVEHGFSVAWSSSPTGSRAAGRPYPRPARCRLDRRRRPSARGRDGRPAADRRRSLQRCSGGLPHRRRAGRRRRPVPGLPAAAAATGQRVQAAPSRLDELDAVPVPVLVVQGRGDRFGIPPSGRRPHRSRGRRRPQPAHRPRSGAGRRRRLAGSAARRTSPRLDHGRLAALSRQI